MSNAITGVNEKAKKIIDWKAIRWMLYGLSIGLLWVVGVLLIHSHPDAAGSFLFVPTFVAGLTMAVLSDGNIPEDITFEKEMLAERERCLLILRAINTEAKKESWASDTVYEHLIELADVEIRYGRK